MRTTLTVDDDLIRELRHIAYESGQPFKTIVNHVLRRGLKALNQPEERKPYKCRTYSLGYPPRANLDRALEIADQLESEEISRKLTLRK